MATGNWLRRIGSQGRWDEAAVLQERVLEARKTVLGERHPGTLTAMGNLASTYRNQGRSDEAMVLQEESARGQEDGARRAAPWHSDGDGQFGFHVLGSRAMGRGGRAGGESAGGQEDGARRGFRHPDTLMAMGNLALTYQNQGRRDEAVVLQERTLEACKTVLGGGIQTLTAMYTWLDVRDQGRWDEAAGAAGDSAGGAAKRCSRAAPRHADDDEELGFDVPGSRAMGRGRCAEVG